MRHITFDPRAAAKREAQALRTLCKPVPITAGMRVNAAYAALVDAWGEAEGRHYDRLAERVARIASLND